MTAGISAIHRRLAQDRGGALRHQGADRHGVHVRGDGVAAVAGVQRDQLLQAQVAHGGFHGGHESRSVLALDLHAVALAAYEQQQVEFRALVRGPEISFVGLCGMQHFLQHEPFPGSAHLGMRMQLRRRAQAKRLVQWTTVAQVRLGRFHLALAQVLVPGRQLPDHEQTGQQVQVPVYGIRSRDQARFPGEVQPGFVPGRIPCVAQRGTPAARSKRPRTAARRRVPASRPYAARGRRVPGPTGRNPSATHPYTRPAVRRRRTGKAGLRWRFPPRRR